jgi:hypothetical protein
MPSTLTWLDHDPAQRERMHRVLQLFTEKGTVDQLGFGGVRDAFSDRLFPGTSTIQKRLRYFLFVPWMYRDLEERRVPSSRAGAVARDTELRLVEVLRAAGERGFLGEQAGESLKILPSAIYWAGLRSWGILRFPRSRGVYHRALDALYARRRRGRDADAVDPDDDQATWHPALPVPPEGWPERVDMELRRQEAVFLQGRILAEHPRSLLALLARGGVEAKVDYPWEHPEYASFTDLHRLVLRHARLFGEVKHAAALLYNLMLAERKRWDEGVERYRAGLDEWQAALDLPALHAWPLAELWELTLGQGHTITPATRRFVEDVVASIREERPLPEHTHARQLVEARERRLKGAHSRFHNARALEDWRGDSGLGRLDYRWPLVQSHLNDLYRGLARG